MALAMARRAWRRRFSSRFAASLHPRRSASRPPLEALVREVAQLLLDRGQPLDDGFVVSSSRASASRSAGWRTSRPAAAQVHHATRVRRRDDAPGSPAPARSSAATLRSRISPRQLGLRARRTRRPRRSTGRRRRSRRSVVRRRRARCAPRRAPSARGAGGTGPARRRCGRSGASARDARVDEPLGEVAHPRRERARPRRCRAAGRSPSSPRRSPRCRRRSARRPASTR